MAPMETSDKKILRVPELAGLLRGMIETRRIPGDAPMDSTRKLAERYGVSPLTANRAINELVEQQVLYRVPGKGTFVSRNRTWRSQGARIGFYPYQGYNLNTRDYYLGMGAFSRTMSDLLKKNGYEISMISDVEKNDISILERTLESIDALMLNKEFITRATLPLLASHRNLVIVMDSSLVSDYPFHQVVPDLFDGFRKAADHFAALGVREVVIAGISDTEAHCHRRQQFRRIMELFHPEITLLGDLTHPFIVNDYGEECGRAIARRYLELPGRPAIFSVSDYLSFGLVEVLLKNKLQPGGDYRLISYDNLEGLGILPFGEPILTTIEHPYEKLGRELVDLLAELLAHPTTTGRVLRVPADTFIIRTTS